ncbi:thioredoxin peroxidase AHP1 [Sporobolomyces salmoneus]|uniref:thioredoxin peroxidase AHP1 n=1 Tax=Sporobolomyces salmoneus TaxID=183962 RepID=UPI0031805DBC
MAPIEVGSTIPSGEFATIEYAPELDDPAVCGRPSTVKTDSWKGKKVVIVAVPGSFTPTCSENHIPPFISGASKLKSKGVDEVYVLASNDVFVQSAWGRVLKAGDKLKFISDSSLKWLKEAGLSQDLSAVGFGERAKRFALILDDLKVTYLGVETGPGVNASGFEAVQAKL